jgi:RimJ/RimL family protein N-acetyltransferase
MKIRLSKAIIRNFKMSDKASIAKHANNRKIWRNVRNAFPHPYTETNAEQWISSILEEKVKTKFAIVVDGKAVGGIGVEKKDDIYSQTMEFGYWIGEEYWNKGIITEAIQVIADYAFDEFDIMRLEAHVYHWNIGSMRALEKAGFEKEAILKKRVFKDGEYVDEHVFAKLKTL